MSKKSKQLAKNKKILALWENYIANNPEWLIEYTRLCSWYFPSLNWRNRWFYQNYNNHIYPYIFKVAQEIKGDYTVKEVIDVFRENYDKD